MSVNDRETTQRGVSDPPAPSLLLISALVWVLLQAAVKTAQIETQSKHFRDACCPRTSHVKRSTSVSSTWHMATCTRDFKTFRSEFTVLIFRMAFWVTPKEEFNFTAAVLNPWNEGGEARRCQNRSAARFSKDAEKDPLSKVIHRLLPPTPITKMAWWCETV